MRTRPPSRVWTWHAVTMTGDVFLTPTDVAEVFDCSVATVLAMIDNAEIIAVKNHGWKIAHSEVSRVFTELQRTAWELGEEVTASPPFALSRPFDADAVN